MNTNRPNSALSEMLSSPVLIWKTCEACGGSGKILLGTGTGMSDGTLFCYEHDCFGCFGNGRILDLGKTLEHACTP
jgi:hypothetical protein